MLGIGKALYNISIDTIDLYFVTEIRCDRREELGTRKDNYERHIKIKHRFEWVRLSSE